MNEHFDTMFDKPDQVAQRLGLTLADEVDEVDEVDLAAQGLATSGLYDMGNGCFLRAASDGFRSEEDFDMGDR